MLNEEEVISFIKSIGGVFSVPELQQEFKADYLTVRRFTGSLVNGGRAEFCGGISFRLIEKEEFVIIEEPVKTEEESPLAKYFREREQRFAEQRRESLKREEAVDDSYELLKDLKDDIYGFLINSDDEDEKTPPRTLWFDYKQFSKAIVLRFANLVRSDFKMARRGAINKARQYLTAVKDTSDVKMIQLYENLLHILNKMSDYDYNKRRELLKNN